MNTTDTGGQAFPEADFLTGRGGQRLQFSHSGMTLRDYFAAKAMQPERVLIVNNKKDFDRVARHAYLLADAMLRARKA